MKEVNKTYDNATPHGLFDGENGRKNAMAKKQIISKKIFDGSENDHFDGRLRLANGDERERSNLGHGEKREDLHCVSKNNSENVPIERKSNENKMKMEPNLNENGLNLDKPKTNLHKIKPKLEKKLNKIETNFDENEQNFYKIEANFDGIQTNSNKNELNFEKIAANFSENELHSNENELKFVKDEPNSKNERNLNEKEPNSVHPKYDIKLEDLVFDLQNRISNLEAKLSAKNDRRKPSLNSPEKVFESPKLNRKKISSEKADSQKTFFPNSPEQTKREPQISKGYISLIDYLKFEVLKADDHGSIDLQVNRTVKNFLSVPRQLERFLFFGLLICVDTFLYILTFLPLRIAFGFFRAFWNVFLCIIGFFASKTMATKGPRFCFWSLLYDLMRVMIMVQCLWSLQSVQMSRAYHYIRGQSMIKLYVLIGMVEIFDKLMCSFGQDALDSLYWSTKMKKKRLTVLNFSIACVYCTLHSFLLFVHITTLTVAVNSSDQALLTLLISNNFNEIKGAVFKKFDKQNLFQLSCHDSVERFKLLLFLGMITLLNISQGGDDNLLKQFVNVFFLVLGGEVLADWVKHAFITKFNLLQPTLYGEYSLILARDITSCRKDDNLLDHTHLVARRLAFATLPLNCVMIRFLQIAAPRIKSYLPILTPSKVAVISVLFYLIILATKVLTGLLLMAHSYILQCDLTKAGKVILPKSPAHSSMKTKKELSLSKLANIARFTLWKGRIV